MLSLIFRYVLRAILTTLSVPAKVCLQCDHPVIFVIFPRKWWLFTLGDVGMPHLCFIVCLVLLTSSYFFIFKLPENLVFLAAAMFCLVYFSRCSVWYLLDIDYQIWILFIIFLKSSVYIFISGFSWNGCNNAFILFLNWDLCIVFSVAL